MTKNEGTNGTVGSNKFGNFSALQEMDNPVMFNRIKPQRTNFKEVQLHQWLNRFGNDFSMSRLLINFTESVLERKLFSLKQLYRIKSHEINNILHIKYRS